MNTQHTKGPWIGQKFSNDQGLVYSESTGKNIAVCYDTKNADLIAAAPDLLEALSHIVVDSDGDGFICKEAMPLIVAAIAKATGGQP